MHIPSLDLLGEGGRSKAIVRLVFGGLEEVLAEGAEEVGGFEDT